MSEDLIKMWTDPTINILNTVWILGWLGTVGYTGLGFWKGFFAMFTWPYYLAKYFKKVNKTTKDLEN